MKTNNTIKQNNSLEQLVTKLKNEDSFYAVISKAITIVYLVLIPLYVVSTILEYTENHTMDTVLSGVCFVVSFLIFAIFFRIYYREYKYVDYSLPTVQMLKKAAYRYKLFQARAIWILVAVILMDIGFAFDGFDEIVPAWVTQVIFIGIMLIAFTIGVVIWYIRYKPLRDEAQRLLHEIEGYN